MKLFLLTVSLFLCSITNAATYYISPTGNDVTGNGSITNPWRTLFKATQTVTTFGDKIRVLAGTYTETQTCILSTGVSIEGDAAATTIIRADETGAWSSLLQLDSPDGTNATQSISKVTLDGQFVSSTNFKTWVAIWVTGRSNVSIHDCIIKNFKQSGVILTGINENNPGTDAGKIHATGNRFYNNSVTNCAAMYQGTGQGSLMIGFQDGLLIYNNLIQQNERPNFENGWPLKYHNQGWLKGCKIYNNTLIKKPYSGDYPGENGNWDFAIEFFNIQGLEIYGNDIQNGAIDLNYNYKRAYAYSTWIHDNLITNTTYNPKVEGSIILEFRTEHALIENNIFNNKAYGISFNTRGPGNYGGDNLPDPGGMPPGGYSYLLNNVIRNNLFTNMYTGQGVGNSFAIGVISEGTDDPQINGLSVYNNTMIGRSGNPSYMGIDLTSMPQGNGQNINIRNNIIQGFGAYPIRGSNPTNITGCFVTHNDFYLNGNNNAVSWPGGNPANYTYNNNISQNPLFVSATNFSLQATSPCIDAGVNVGIPYNGSAPDMGYVEYGATGNIPPTANAGPDQTITLPTNTVSLTGTGIDPDGNITAYLWTKIAGPAAGTITNPNNAATTVTGLVQGVYRFELRVTDNNNAYGRDTVQITVNAASNIPPTANAGPDQTITLPTNTVSLTGTGIDPDGNITAYLWTKIAGPTAGTITNPNNAATTVTGLVQGVYRFELRVTDNNNAFGRDTVQITVNAASNIPPTANAGPDQTIILPTNVVIVSGSGTDPDGFITAYLWTKISGPANGSITNPNVAATSITGLVQGVYRFELRVTDNNGAFGRDTMQVTVNAGATNTPPSANAGPDQTITLPTNTVILSGSGIDPDGFITAYLWTKVAGPAAGTITNPNSAATSVTGLVQGVYQFELRVTDNNNAFGRDTVQITVNAASNIPPTANAGPDQTITLPTNTVSLSGTGIDPDGNITAWLWTKVSGPAAGTITNPNSAATTVTGMVQGVYRFELRVTDNNNAFGRDTVQITVNAASNIPPTANAGADQTIILPTNTVSLSGTGIDPDGFITAYLWTKVSGPANGTITNPNSAATTVTGLVQGVYRFELRVTDNNGAFGRDTVQVTVIPGATNTPPSANAGTDQSITLPVNSVIISGSGIDPDGIITAYLWTKVAGPAAGTITNPNSAATSVTGLVQGVYRFELRVTDNSGAFGRDTVQVTVNTASNIPPTANAGPDQNVTLPANSVSLTGTGTDPDGNITAWLWTKVSGPAAGTITNANTAATAVTGLVEGVYQFELRVTDNNNAVGRDTIRVTVYPVPNNPPNANAGPNLTITLPDNTATLTGTGTDTDGSIAAYNWRQVTGPSGNVLFSTNTAITFLTNLVEGTYEFELTVTDNRGATASDLVIVVVIGTSGNQLQYNDINVYPNPVADIATLEIKASVLNSKQTVTITDMHGKIVFRKDLSYTQQNFNEKIDMRNLIKGTYIVTVYFENGEKKNMKIVKM